jgi:hypothetical protein
MKEITIAIYDGGSLTSLKPVETFWYRGQKCKHCDKIVPVFGLGHHVPESDGEDEFSKKGINFYKWGNKKEETYFLERINKLYQERFKGTMNFDIICIIPSHEQGKSNEHMEMIAQKIAATIGARFARLLERGRTVKSQHELPGVDAREENVRGSLTVKEDVRGKSILVLDNTCISGANSRTAFDCLTEAGACNVVFIILGLGNKAKDIDFDINPAYRGSAKDIIEKWHWPKVPKDKREDYKKQRKDTLA